MNCLVIKHPLPVSLYEVMDNTVLVAIKFDQRIRQDVQKYGLNWEVLLPIQSVILGVSVLS